MVGILLSRLGTELPILVRKSDKLLQPSGSTDVGQNVEKNVYQLQYLVSIYSCIHNYSPYAPVRSAMLPYGRIPVIFSPAST